LYQQVPVLFVTAVWKLELKKKGSERITIWDCLYKRVFRNYEAKSIMDYTNRSVAGISDYYTGGDGGAGQYIDNRIFG
ncbi:MAG: hypothetical protein ACTJFI_08605, partial [Enterococcus viikkiensis]